jgi:hypothetical protein
MLMMVEHWEGRIVRVDKENEEYRKVNQKIPRTAFLIPLCPIVSYR